MTHADPDEDTPHAMERSDTVSARLLSAREGKGLSQKEVADELFLTTTFIRYIDEGEFDKIPKPAFIKGYLRSYSRVVGLSGDEIVEAFEREQDIAPQTPKVVDVTERASPPSGGMGSPVVQTGLIGLLLLLVVGAGVWIIAGEDEPDPVVTSSREVPVTAPREFEDDLTSIDDAASDPVAAPSMAPAGATAEETGVPLFAADGPVPGDATGTASEGPETISTEPEVVSGVEEAEITELPADAAARVDESRQDAGNAAVEAAPEVQIERIREGETIFITVYAGGEAEMGFEFSDECWVEITDANDLRVYADLNREGDVMTVYGNAPFDVLLGRAPAVRMTVDGEPVDIARFTTQDDTARVRTARL